MESESSMAKLITAQELVKRVGLGYRVLLKLSNEGSIPCLRISNRFFYNPEVIDNWIRINAATPAYAKIKM